MEVYPLKGPQNKLSKMLSSSKSPNKKTTDTSSESEEKFEYPTASQIQKDVDTELQRIIRESGIPKERLEGFLGRFKILLLHFPNDKIMELMCIDQSVMKNNVQQLLKKVPSDFKKYDERFEIKLKQRTEAKVHEFLAKEDRIKNEESRKKLCTDIMSQNTYSSLFVLDSDKANFLTTPQKQKLFSELLTKLPYLDLYFQRPPLASRVKDLVHELVEAFVGKLHIEIIEEIVNSIMKEKDPNLRTVVEHKRLRLSIQEKEKLVDCIASKPIYMEFCETEGKDLTDLKNKFHKDLMTVLWKIAPADEREKIAEILLENPSDSIDFNCLGVSSKEQLRETLSRMQSRKSYKLQKEPFDDLQVKKKIEIRKILENAYVTQKDAEELRPMMQNFSLPGLLKHKSMEKKWLQVYKDIETDEGDNYGYREARRTNNVDIRRANKNAVQWLFRQFEKATVFDSRLLEDLARNVIGNCNTVEIDKFIDKLRDRMKHLVFELYSQPDSEFKKYSENKPSPNLKEESKNQLLNSVVQFVRVFEHGQQIVDNMLTLQSLDEVEMTNYISGREKDSLKEHIAANCPKFHEYIRLWTHDIPKSQQKMRIDFVKKCEELGIKVKLTEELVEKVCGQKNLLSVKEEKLLPEVVRQELIKFFEAAKSGQDYLKCCRVEKMVLSSEKLKNQITEIFGKMQKNEENLYYLDSITEIVMDFCEVDNRIEEVKWDSIPVSSLLQDHETKQLLQNKIPELESFKNFRLFYPELLDLQLQRAERIFKRFFENLLETQKIDQKDSYQVLKDSDFQFLNIRKIFKGLKPVQQESLQLKCMNSVFYKKLMNLLKAKDARKFLIAQINFQLSVDRLFEDINLNELDNDYRLLFLRKIKEYDTKNIFACDHLSKTRKINLVKKIIESAEFKTFVATNTEGEKNSKVEQFRVSMENYCNGEQQRENPQDGNPNPRHDPSLDNIDGTSQSRGPPTEAQKSPRQSDLYS